MDLQISNIEHGDEVAAVTRSVCALRVVEIAEDNH